MQTQTQSQSTQSQSQSQSSSSVVTFADYDTVGFYDELIAESGKPRKHARLLMRRLESLAPGELLRRQEAAERSLLRMGITFNVYGDKQGHERIFPFDVIPRIVDAADWDYLERGLKQRIKALNLFINDVYHEQTIIKEGIVPAAVLAEAASYRQACHGLNPPHGVWCHITGTDLVRNSDGQYYVLEDNLRCPSGVSYVLQNRAVMKRSFPKVFDASKIRPVQ